MHTLIAAPVSLFSGKARAYLRWKGVAFTEILPTPEVMKRDVIAHTGWPVIPVLHADDGTVVQDTADIIDFIEAAHPGTPVMPADPVQAFATQLLHTFADQWLTLPAMHYRWNHNADWILAEFGRTAAPDADPATQLTIGTRNGQAFRAMVAPLGITPDTIPAIEAGYLAFLDEFSAHLAQHPFTFGDRPGLADFALYGPLYAHLYRDPASGKLMQSRAPSVYAWVERLRDGDYGSGDLTTGVPDTLLPLLARHFTEHGPVLRATNALLGAHSDNTLPRALGMVDFTLGATTGQTLGKTLARPFSLFRLQAALDIYDAMDSTTKGRADALLDATNGTWLKDFRIAKRLVRRDYKLAVA